MHTSYISCLSFLAASVNVITFGVIAQNMYITIWILNTKLNCKGKIVTFLNMMKFSQAVSRVKWLSSCSISKCGLQSYNLFNKIKNVQCVSEDAYEEYQYYDAFRM
jgi:hypothetical protein